ncbi:Protein CBG25611 [Caenorhabditis briggsae]|uniref:Protein CBG25611 n=1 Tax=Caenorhabditis briggsae TaxID=6238 RepID=B6IF96_CAEBR|nr:Protein CBG25611 [Caenorhabditis briggsae]CAR98576.1 Protein CBG25611 [Caenorhabditis briggsae]
MHLMSLFTMTASFIVHNLFFSFSVAVPPFRDDTPQSGTAFPTCGQSDERWSPDLLQLRPLLCWTLGRRSLGPRPLGPRQLRPRLLEQVLHLEKIMVKRNSYSHKEEGHLLHAHFRSQPGVRPPVPQSHSQDSWFFLQAYGIFPIFEASEKKTNLERSPEPTLKSSPAERSASESTSELKTSESEKYLGSFSIYRISTSKPPTFSSIISIPRKDIKTIERSCTIRKIQRKEGGAKFGRPRVTRFGEEGEVWLYVSRSSELLLDIITDTREYGVLREFCLSEWSGDEERGSVLQVTGKRRAGGKKKKMMKKSEVGEREIEIESISKVSNGITITIGPVPKAPGLCRKLRNSEEWIIRGLNISLAKASPVTSGRRLVRFRQRYCGKKK